MSHRLIIAIIAATFAVATTSCSSGTPMPAGQGAAPELTGLAAPEGVSPALWKELKSELESQLAARGTSVVKSIDDPSLRVDDFAVSGHDPETETLTFSWSYKLAGDYDLNGEVGMSDLGPIAKYYRDTPASPDWDMAQFADGDGNGEVNGSDIGPISASFGTAVHGFFFSPEYQDYDQNGEVNLSDLHAIGARMLRPNPGATFTGPLFGQPGEFTGFGEVRTSDSELPDVYIGLYGFPMTAENRTLVAGRLHFSAHIGYDEGVPSTYFTLVPYRVVPPQAPATYDLGIFSDQYLYVTGTPQ